jgi:signal transduction histidine kinase/ActR/RegA family two-component response regulator
MRSEISASVPGTGARGARDELVLVLAPTGRDTPLACRLLADRAGVTTEACSEIVDLCQKIRAGAGAVVIAEEALDFGGARLLLDVLAEQLPWSDLPVLILARADSATGAGIIDTLRRRGNVTLLDRPVRIVSLITAVHSALRARRRQYEVRDLLAETRHAVRQRDQFLAMLGHELRNPLGTISSALGVISAANPQVDSLEAEQRDIIHRQVNHLARLVDDLLDVSRITSGKIALQRQTIDLCELIRAAAKAAHGPARAHRHEVKVTASCGPLFVDADPVRMEQVVSNLLTNAIKYTPPGGKIQLHVDSVGPDAILRVRDDGIGMSPELLPRVFDLFTQAERALDRSQGGLGIGLTLVRALVEMHGGKVSVHSDGPGHGSEFIVTLPRIAAAHAVPVASEPSKPVVHSNGQGRRILIVEDQPDARRALQRLLQIWGYQVDVAEEARRALEVASTHRPEVALVDVGLPGIDGYELARRFRARFGQAIRLVALTGYGQPEDRQRAYDAGFDLHLVKPVDRDQIANALGGFSEEPLHRTQPA